MTKNKLRKYAKEKLINKVLESRKNGFKPVYYSNEFRHLKLTHKEILSAGHRAFKSLNLSGVPVAKHRKDNGRNFGFQPVIGLKAINQNKLDDRIDFRNEIDFYANQAEGVIKNHNLLVEAGAAAKLYKPKEATRMLK